MTGDDNTIPELSYLSCFFPAYEEEANIGALLEEALRTCPGVAERWEIVVVDDGSTDQTASIVQAFAAEHPQVRLVQHPVNSGYAASVRTGLAECQGDFVFYTDADLQFRLADLQTLLPSLEAADLVIGYRVNRQDPWRRRVVAEQYNKVLRRIFDLEVHDVDCAFKIFNRKVVDTILGDLRSQSAFISAELVLRARAAGFRISEVGVKHYPRVAGKARGAPPDLIVKTIYEMCMTRLTLSRRQKPLRRARHPS